MSIGRPKVSIGLPVYNGERFLGEALESVLAQTFEDYELIISDNASTDKTQEICQEYSRRDPRIRYYKNEVNFGAAQNFNRVFALSSGEYFKWLAYDDVCSPSFLARCAEALDDDSSVVLAYPRARCIDENGTVLHNYERIIEDVSWPTDVVERCRKLVDGFSLDDGVSAPVYIFGLIRSSALRQTRLIGNFMSSDLSLLLELALLGNFFVVPEHLSLIRSHAGSSSRNEHMTRPDRVQDWYDPAVTRRALRVLFRWKRYFEYVSLIIGSRLHHDEKATLLLYVANAVLRRLRKRLGEERPLTSKKFGKKMI